MNRSRLVTILTEFGLDEKLVYRVARKMGVHPEELIANCVNADLRDAEEDSEVFDTIKGQIKLGKF